MYCFRDIHKSLAKDNAVKTMDKNQNIQLHMDDTKKDSYIDDINMDTALTNQEEEPAERHAKEEISAKEKLKDAISYGQTEIETAFSRPSKKETASSSQLTEEVEPDSQSEQSPAEKEISKGELSKNEETEVSDRGYGSRFREIMGVLHAHHITKGMTPEKFRLILEDLGPTYIKIGQIMSSRSDILPQSYCDELARLRSDVPPMPFEDVEDVLNSSLGFHWKEEFRRIDEEPLGSASIAQVHKALLKNGTKVVIKVQRKGIYQTMSRDIGLLHKAVGLLPPISIRDMVDLNMVLKELWTVTQEEMNFLMEAGNMEEFARLNRNVAYVNTPTLFREYTSTHVLVMEYIDGVPIDQKDKLVEKGYDLKEVGMKYIDNFIKQVMDDGFFHADPHPGNVMVRGGQIIWMDMGMMGRLTEHDRELLGMAIQGIARHDISMIQDAILGLGEFKKKPDPSSMYEDIRELVDHYGTADFGTLDVVSLLTDIMTIMQNNKIIMPHGMTLLVRAMSHMEGILAQICPDINMVEIAIQRMSARLLDPTNLKKELKSNAKILYRSMVKAIEVPSLAVDVMKGHMKGRTKMNLELHTASDLDLLLRRLVRNMVIGLWVTALLISSSIICTTNMKPKMLGIPALGFFGYVIAFMIVIYVLIRHFFSKR